MIVHLVLGFCCLNVFFISGSISGIGVCDATLDNELSVNISLAANSKPQMSVTIDVCVPLRDESALSERRTAQKPRQHLSVWMRQTFLQLFTRLMIESKNFWFRFSRLYCDERQWMKNHFTIEKVYINKCVDNRVIDIFFFRFQSNQLSAGPQ